MRMRFPHWRAILFTASAATAVGMLLLADTAVTIEKFFPGTGEPPAECAIVFGAAVYRNALPSPSLQRRVQTAVRLYHEGRIEHIFVTGGKGSALQRSEAEVMKSVALNAGIPDSAITMEEQARSTWENLLFTRPFTTQCSSILAISDRYHLARITLLAEQQGWTGLKTFPADELPPRRSELRSFLREIAAYLYYEFRLNRALKLEPTSTASPLGNPS